MTPVEWALALADRGLYVFPIYEPVFEVDEPVRCACGKPECGLNIGKHPRVDDWPNESTTDRDEIVGWFTKWPNANVAVDTGKSGLIVPDVDPAKGGDKSLDALVIEHGRSILETVTVHTGATETGQRGRHLWFRADGFSMRSFKAKDTPFFGDGIDGRAEGGYVIAPGSIHRSGAQYEFEVGDDEPDAQLASFPASLRVLAKRPDSIYDTQGGSETKKAECARGKKSCPDFDAIRAELRAFVAGCGVAIYLGTPGDGGSRISAECQEDLLTPAARDAEKVDDRGNVTRKGTQVHFDFMIWASHQFQRVYGFESDGLRLYLRAIALRRKISPELEAAYTPARHPLREAAARDAWASAARQQFDPPAALFYELKAEVEANPAANATTRGGLLVYAVLLLEALRLGVPLSGFSKANSTLAKLLVKADGTEAPGRTVRRWIDAGAKLGLFTVVPGKPHTRWHHGSPNRYALLTVSAERQQIAERVEAVERAALIEKQRQVEARPQKPREARPSA